MDLRKNIPLDASTLQTIRQRGRDSLFFFARGILGFEDLTPHIHKPVCDKLSDYKNNTRCAIVLPRDWFKSTIGSIAYPIWRAINNPNVRILIVQNSMNNARKKLLSIKQIFERNQLFRALYPEILPDKNRTWTQECLVVNRTGTFPEGTFEAAGVGTAVTSRHFDLVIEDDTISPEKDSMSGLVQQPTQLEIEKAIGFHRLVHPLLLHPSKSQIVVIGTRWAVEDLLGWIMANYSNYIVISRKVRENGVAIWDRFNEDVLEDLEITQGPYMFASLYMNEPTLAINQVFNREWIRYYQNMPRRELLFCTSVDPAAAKREESSNPDYSVVLTTAVHPSDGTVYVASYTRERMNPGQHIDAIFHHYEMYKPVVVKIEAIAYQRTLGYWLRRRQDKTGTKFYVEEIRSLQGSKEDRIRALQPYFSSGQIRIRTGMSDLERELLSFPKGAHDDLIDALSMQVGFWNDAIALKVEERNYNKKIEPHSGRAILDNLKSRVVSKHRYPYDIGLKRDTHVGYREYQYA